MGHWPITWLFQYIFFKFSHSFCCTCDCKQTDDVSKLLRQFDFFPITAELSEAFGVNTFPPEKIGFVPKICNWENLPTTKARNLLVFQEPGGVILSPTRALCCLMRKVSTFVLHMHKPNIEGTLFQSLCCFVTPWVLITKHLPAHNCVTPGLRTSCLVQSGWLKQRHSDLYIWPIMSEGYSRAQMKTTLALHLETVEDTPVDAVLMFCLPRLTVCVHPSALRLPAAIFIHTFHCFHLMFTPQCPWPWSWVE